MDNKIYEILEVLPEKYRVNPAGRGFLSTSGYSAILSFKKEYGEYTIEYKTPEENRHQGSFFSNTEKSLKEALKGHAEYIIQETTGDYYKDCYERGRRLFEDNREEINPNELSSKLQSVLDKIKSSEIL